MTRRSVRLAGLATLVVAGLVAGVPARAQAQEREAAKPFVVEYYYKARWGHFDEFLRLFKKNHYPVLLEEQRLGRIVGVSAARPRYHATEDGRWDLRVTITWRDAATAHDGFDPAGLIAKLYPDKALFDREEQQRFEILEAHWDVPVQDAPLDR